MTTAFYTEHTARTAHQCDMCRKPILPGQRYKRSALPPQTDIGNEQWWVICEHVSPIDCAYLDDLMNTPGTSPPETGEE